MPVAPRRCLADCDMGLDCGGAPGRFERRRPPPSGEAKTNNSPKIKKQGSNQTASGLGTLLETGVRWHRRDPGAHNRATKTSLQRTQMETRVPGQAAGQAPDVSFLDILLSS